MYGIKLRQLRRQLGLTQRQLGTLCGVGGTTISMIEHGKRLPGRETLRRLQVVLGDLPPRPAKPLPTAELLTLLMWEGDKIFLRLLDSDEPFFSLKLCYDGDRLESAVLNGKQVEL
jgi:transcriptional regulator with XRE-family HTH domain